ncbi:MAG TPA: alpha/beta hydrolase domain-containing protein [Terriglobia bacterium]|nr:alpha/beta hydrolase domain-containing protein [Terriglobia bacterium]
MKLTHVTLSAFILALGATTLPGQTPIPVPGQNQQQGQRGGGQGRGGQRGAERPPEPVKQVVAPIPTAVEVTGPGAFFETFMDDHDDARNVQIPAKDVYAKYNYEAKEYFISGTTSSGQPYKTRIVIRKPKDNGKFSGLILAESMHPSGNPWVFHFVQTYAMSSGIIGLEMLTSASPGLVANNEVRYKDLNVPNNAANDIIAQVGALLKSNHKDNPLSGLTVRKMILTGSSASAGVATQYLTNAHMAMRMADMKPIYDGFMPTSANGQIPVLDVPTILVPTMRETYQGRGTTQPDNDKLRVYEFAGMAHIDSRVAGAYYPDPCKHAISRYPMGAMMAVGVDKLFTWVDKGIAPPHADRFYVDFNPDNKPELDRNNGALLALDEFGNVKGGIRNTYVDVPTKSFHAPNEGADPPVANANPWIANRGVQGINQLCGLGNYEVALTREQLKKLYKDPKDYQSKVAKRYDELVKQGWALPVYRDMVLAEAGRVTF